MGLIDKIKKVWHKEKSYYAPGFSMLVNGAFNWKYNGKTKQLTVGYQNKIVYAVVNVLVKKLIEAPIIVSKVTNDKKLMKLKNYNFSRGNHDGKLNLLKLKAIEELDSHPLIDLLNEPNNYQTGIELRESFWYNYQLTGDGFIFAEVNGDKPVFFHCLPSDRISLYRSGNDWRMPITRVVFNAWDGTNIEIPLEYLMHMSKWSPLDPLQGGFSPLQSAGSAVSKNDENDLMQGQMYKNGGTGTIISSDILVQDGKSYSKLSVEQVSAIQKTIDINYAGAKNAGRMHVTNGHVNVQKFGDTLVDLNAINADNQDAVRIAAAWGVSPILIGDMSGGTDNNVKGAYKALVTNVVIPELRKFDAKFKKFSSKWYKGERLDVSHDFTEFSELAPDLELMQKVYGNAWQISGNEYRRIVNMETSDNPNMDKYLVPMGLTDLDNAFTDDFDNTPNSDVL